MIYKQSSLYTPTGYGVLDIDLMQGGVNIILSLDDKDATNCMLANPHYFNHKVICTDIKDITIEGQLRPDIMAFTYPCTKYAIATDIRGIKHKAKNQNLIKRLRAIKKTYKVSKTL